MFKFINFHCKKFLMKNLCARKSYYDILQVSKNASAQEIKVSYIELSKMYHPDNPKTGSEDRIKLINEAYDVLSRPSQRIKYDMSLRNKPIVNSNMHPYHPHPYYYSQYRYRKPEFTAESKAVLMYIYSFIFVVIILQYIRIYYMLTKETEENIRKIINQKNSRH